MTSDKKREEVIWLTGKEGGFQESTQRGVPVNEFCSTRESAHQQAGPDVQEPLPSYERELSPASGLVSQSTTSSLRSSQVSTQNPTPESPFTFPTEGPPPYTPPRSIERFLAIPQTHRSPTAPFVVAYPPVLSAYGITQETWNSFIGTVSAFLAARTSKRMLAHATDIASAVPRKLGKDLLSTTTNAGKSLGHSAKHLNPFGIVGSAVGFVFGVTGAVVGSVFHAPAAVTAPPRTPVERAEAYLTAANKKWLHARNLHVMLLSMGDVAIQANIPPQQILEAALAARSGGIVKQMAALQPWVGEMIVGKQNEAQRAGQQNRLHRHDNRMGSEKDQRSFERGALSVGLSVTGSLSVEERNEVETTSSSTGIDTSLALELGLNTIWLVVTRLEGEVAP